MELDNEIERILGIKIKQENMLYFFVPGKPFAQTRARHVMQGGKFHVYSDGNKSLREWKAKIRSHVKAVVKDSQFAPLASAIRINLAFLIPIKDKKRWWCFNTSKPDKDNLEKAVLDAINDTGLVFALDDSQVTDGRTMKLCVPPEQAGVLVVVEGISIIKKSPEAQASDGGQVTEWLSQTT